MKKKSIVIILCLRHYWLSVEFSRKSSIVELMADVLSSLDSDDVWLINALSFERHKGEGTYFRPYRITSSINIPAKQFVNLTTQNIVAFSQMDSTALPSYRGCAVRLSFIAERKILHSGCFRTGRTGTVERIYL